MSPEAARIFRNASPEERRWLEMLIDLQILAGRKPHSLIETMDEIGRKAQERGLTPEILEEIQAEE